MLLILKDISKQYTLEKSFLGGKKFIVDALNGINFNLQEKTVLGILGETGSGKTTLAKLIVQLIQPTSGQIEYNFDNTRRQIQMVFQNPFNSLNPRMNIGNILKEPFLIHKLASKKQLNSKLKDLLNKVSINDDVLNRYPDEFSGGQRQRIAIARAIAVNPTILVCDEPTSSLDLSVQAQILNLFVNLKDELGLSYIFISHNIEVISFIADEVLVLYEGRQVERGLKYKVFSNPCHPYTKVLLGSDSLEALGKLEENDNYGCKFYANCRIKSNTCKTIYPQEVKLEEGHYVSCQNFR